MLIRALVLVLGLAIVTTSCASGAGGDSTAASGATGATSYVESSLQDDPVDPNAGFDEVVPNWDNPVEGPPVESAADATNDVTFDVREPTGLGQAIGIFVSPEEVPKEAAAVAFVYDTSDFGRVDVVEHLPESSPEEYQKFHEYLVSINGDPLVHGRFDLVTIRSGVEALVTTSEDGSRSVVFWLEDGIEFIVEGPTLTFDQAVKVAELV
jgi:hypothetical protein